MVCSSLILHGMKMIVGNWPIPTNSRCPPELLAPYPGLGFLLGAPWVCWWWWWWWCWGAQLKSWSNLIQILIQQFLILNPFFHPILISFYKSWSKRKMIWCFYKSWSKRKMIWSQILWKNISTNLKTSILLDSSGSTKFMCIRIQVFNLDPFS